MAYIETQRLETLERIAQELERFEGHTIDFVVLAPGRGNLAAIVGMLKNRKAWPLRAKWRVAMYSGKFNLRGMTSADVATLEELQTEPCGAGEPMADLSKFPFFGRQDAHPTTSSLGTFVLPGFGETLYTRDPLLSAVLRLFDDEFNAPLILCSQEKLFMGSEVSSEELERFKEHRARYEAEGIHAFATAMHRDVPLHSKVCSQRKAIIGAFANNMCDSPLCDQLIFFARWLRQEQPEALTEHIGHWVVDRDSRGEVSFSRVDLGGESTPSTSRRTTIRAVQPVLTDPNDEALLQWVRETATAFVFQHLTQICGGEEEAPGGTASPPASVSGQASGGVNWQSSEGGATVNTGSTTAAVGELSPRARVQFSPSV